MTITANFFLWEGAVGTCCRPRVNFKYVRYLESAHAAPGCSAQEGMANDRFGPFWGGDQGVCLSKTLESEKSRLSLQNLSSQVNCQFPRERLQLFRL